MQFYLNFHHHIILVTSNEELILKKLQDEFHFFIQNSADKVHTMIELFHEAQPELPSMVADKVMEDYNVYHMGSRQYTDYHGKALSIWDHQEEMVRIYSLEAERLYLLAFHAIHFVLGPALDLKGMCRIQALAVSLKHVNAVVMLPAKNENHSLLQHLLENSDINIISDTKPLIDLHGNVHPFPSETDRIETQSFNHPTLLIAGLQLSSGESILTPVPKWKMLKPIFEHMISGSFHPIQICMRMFCAIQLLRKSKCYYLYMGADRAYNARLISEQLYEN